MPVNVQEIIKKLEAQRDRNVKYLEKKAPQIIELALKPSKLSSCGIYIDPTTGKIDLQINGERIYKGDPRSVTLAQIEEFERSGVKFYVTPDTNTQYKDIMMDMRHWDDFLNVAKEYPKSDFIKKPVQPGDKFGTFLSIGIGLGYHLEIITKRYEIKQLIVAEKDSEILKASLFTIDWRPIIEKYSGGNRFITFFIKNDPVELAKEVSTFLQFYTNTPIAFVMPVFVHIQMPFYKEFFDELYRRFSQIFTGWGFFQDELWSVKQTIENIKQEIPLFTGEKKVSQDAKAFIIGAGPSLENYVEFIRENRDNAVVFSCGSSIGTLYRENIIPDFHVEIERTKITYDALILGADREFLKSIPAVFNNPIYPDVPKLFENKGMFLKENDAGAYLFPPEYLRLIYTNPTVVNGGVSLALHLGFREIYLFGADMGYKDPAKHHARGNVALDSKTEFFKEYEDSSMQIEGNFGGMVYTNFILNWARTWIEDLVKLCPDARVYNTSDGAKIKGTIPVRENEIKLSKFDKNSVIKLIKSNFTRDYLLRKDYINNKIIQLEREVREFRDYSFKQLSSKIKDTYELMDKLHNIYAWIHVNKENSGLLHLIIRGGFLHFEHLVLFLCYQKEIRGIRFIDHSVSALRNYIDECSGMLLNALLSKI